jgi:trafficking protein particle complex subunit 12
VTTCSPLASPSSSAISKPPKPSARLSPSRSPSRKAVADIESRDLSFLLQPQNFSKIPPPLIPQEPTERTYAALVQLVKRGLFNSTAVLSVQLITDLPDASDTQMLFDLWYIRLASLTLINQTKIAAAESKVLGDLTSPFYRDDLTKAHMVPWHLRVLAVRLQALGFGEWRRGIMAYYILAEEARQEANTAIQEEKKVEVRLWKSRLYDIGVLVAGSLVETGDLEAAARHLKTLELDRDLRGPTKKNVTTMEALIYLKLGDLNAASHCLTRISSPIDPSSGPESPGSNSSEDQDAVYVRKLLNALILTCQSDAKTALKEWQDLSDQYPDDAMIQHNCAVAALYTCDLNKSREALETLIDSQNVPVFHTLLFNMATLYELSTENSQSLKTDLVNRVSQNVHDNLIRERPAIDFKLDAR